MIKFLKGLALSLVLDFGIILTIIGFSKDGWNWESFAGGFLIGLFASLVQRK